MKKDVREISQEELEEFFLENNQQKFRIKQLNEWLWEKGVNSFDQMSSLSKDLRDLLNKKFEFKSAKIDQKFQSTDKTIKFSFKLFDDKLVEGVLIPSKKRVTACVSSQIGCSLDCTFCATGTMGLTRNLSSSEIFDQVFKLNEESKINYGRSLTNLSLIHISEPTRPY